MIIDVEFEGLIPPLTDKEYSGLEQSIINEGCRDALICWGDILVDGHNRYRICEKHNLPFKTVNKDFENKNEAKLWILQNQLARRNLNDFQRIEIVRKCEEAIKEQAKSRMLATLKQNQNTAMENFPQRTARDELGAMAQVSGKTYEHAAEILDKAPAPIADAVRNNELSINSGYEVTKLTQEAQEEISSRIVNGEEPRAVVKEVQNRPHVSYNTGNNEWYTPSEYIELARTVMTSIDLDPASSEKAQEIVKAGTYYTAQTDGLNHSWFGNVWLNPPYSSELITKFADKLINELIRIKQAVILVNNATETEWFSKIVKRSQAVCFPLGRVKFYRPDGTTGAPLQGQAVIYYGNQAKRFVDVFSAKGWCALINDVR